MANKSMDKLNVYAVDLNLVIGNLDRILSEFLYLCELDEDEVDIIDRQTLKHHADDLIGVGQKALQLVTPYIESKGLDINRLITEAGRLGLTIDEWSDRIDIRKGEAKIQATTKYELKLFLAAYALAKTTRIILSPTITKPDYLIEQGKKYGFDIELTNKTLVVRRKTRLVMSFENGDYDLAAIFLEGAKEALGERDENNLHDEDFEKEIEEAYKEVDPGNFQLQFLIKEAEGYGWTVKQNKDYPLYVDVIKSGIIEQSNITFTSVQYFGYYLQGYKDAYGVPNKEVISTAKIPFDTHLRALRDKAAKFGATIEDHNDMSITITLMTGPPLSFGDIDDADKFLWAYWLGRQSMSNKKDNDDWDHVEN